MQANKLAVLAQYRGHQGRLTSLPWYCRHEVCEGVPPLRLQFQIAATG
jgi:hypothetical protein